MRYVNEIRLFIVCRLGKSERLRLDAAHAPQSDTKPVTGTNVVFARFASVSGVTRKGQQRRSERHVDDN
jgi:hypothetical protein